MPFFFLQDAGADISVSPQNLVTAQSDIVGSITLKTFLKKDNFMADLVMADIQDGGFDKRIKLLMYLIQLWTIHPRRKLW